MEIDIIKKTWPGIRFWVIASSIVIVVAGMKQMSNLILMILMALFITAVSVSPFLWLKKKKFPDILALVIVVIGIMGIIYGFTVLLGASVSGFTEKLPFYEARLSEFWVNLHQKLVEVNLVDEDADLIKVLQSTNIMNSSGGGAVAGLGKLVSDPLVTLFIYIFMMLEITNLNRKMELMSPKSLGSMLVIRANIRKYFGIKFLTSFATGFVIYIGLIIIGVDFPLLWGLIAFMLNFIPSIGSIFAAIPAVLLAFIQLDPISGLATGLLYLITNVVVGSIVEPPLMGRNLGLSPLVVFLSLLIWGFVLGPVGMLLSAPLTMVIKIIFDSRPQTQGIGILLGDKSSLDVLEKRKREMDKDFPD